MNRILYKCKEIGYRSSFFVDIPNAKWAPESGSYDLSHGDFNAKMEKDHLVLSLWFRDLGFPPNAILDLKIENGVQFVRLNVGIKWDDILYIIFKDDAILFLKEGGQENV